MAIRKKGWWLFMTAYWKTFATLVAIPAAIGIGFFLVGLNTELFERIAVIETARHIGKIGITAILVLIAIIAGALTTDREVQKDREESERLFGQEKEELIKKHNEEMTKAETNFYLVNSNARRERAHYIFCSLHVRGESLLANDSNSVQEWQRWDRDVRLALKLCFPTTEQLYLAETHRLGSDSDDEPLSADRYQNAVECIRSNVLDRKVSDIFQ